VARNLIAHNVRGEALVVVAPAQETPMAPTWIAHRLQFGTKMHLACFIGW